MLARAHGIALRRGIELGEVGRHVGCGGTAGERGGVFHAAHLGKHLLLHLCVGGSRGKHLQLLLAALSHLHVAHNVEGCGAQAYVAVLHYRHDAVPILSHPGDSHRVGTDARLRQKIVLQFEGAGVAAHLVSLVVARGSAVADERKTADAHCHGVYLQGNVAQYGVIHVLIKLACVHAPDASTVGKGDGAADCELLDLGGRGSEKLYPLGVCRLKTLAVRLRCCQGSGVSSHH